MLFSGTAFHITAAKAELGKNFYDVCYPVQEPGAAAAISPIWHSQMAW